MKSCDGNISVGPTELSSSLPAHRRCTSYLDRQLWRLWNEDDMACDIVERLWLAGVWQGRAITLSHNNWQATIVRGNIVNRVRRLNPTILWFSFDRVKCPYKRPLLRWPVPFVLDEVPSGQNPTVLTSYGYTWILSRESRDVPAQRRYIQLEYWLPAVFTYRLMCCIRRSCFVESSLTSIN